MTERAIVSGVPYPVLHIDGATPASLADFVTAGTFTVEMADGVYTVVGSGAQNDDTVRFHEKAQHSGGKDVRVWRITADGSGFVAEHSAVF